MQIKNNPKIPKNQYNRSKTIYYLSYNVPQIPSIKFNHRLAVASSRQLGKKGADPNSDLPG